MNQLFVNDLTVIDFSYFDYQRGIVGESWIVDIVLGGELDQQGMVFDFGHVKKRIKALIDEEVDHRFVLSSQANSLQVESDHSGDEQYLSLCWQGASGNFKHESPAQAVLLMDAKTVNKKSVAAHLEDKIQAILPDNVSSVSLTLREEVIDGAYYHYSHGLKKHDGNCQRIVHGHRSKIEIFQNNQRNLELEDLWAARFRNIYIATNEDLIDSFESDGKTYYRFAYEACQGQFSLSLPAKKVYRMDSDSTVELIAAHIADCCALDYPDNYFEVRAYEGVGKGAIAIRKG